MDRKGYTCSCTDQLITLSDSSNGDIVERNRARIREHYSDAINEGSCCCGCGSENNVKNTMTLKEAAQRLGYTEEQLSAIPDEVGFSFGCGNPVAIASLLPGEVVLDLGSGSGFDCAIAADRVGEEGLVIGVDMTPEMLQRARRTFAGRRNMEFRLGEIEHLPVAEESIDVIISNCVINLSQDKTQVFREAFRVLRSGGRLAISDVVRLRSFEGTKWENDASLSECISGSIPAGELKELIEKAGFVDVRIVMNEKSGEFINEWDPDTGVENYICSALIEARRPGS